MSDRISEPQPLSYARRRECPDGGTSNRAGRQVGNSGFHGVGGEGGATGLPVQLRVGIDR